MEKEDRDRLTRIEANTETLLVAFNKHEVHDNTRFDKQDEKIQDLEAYQNKAKGALFFMGLFASTLGGLVVLIAKKLIG